MGRECIDASDLLGLERHFETSPRLEMVAHFLQPLFLLLSKAFEESLSKGF